MVEKKLNAEEVRRLYDQHGPALVAYARGFVTDAAAAEYVVHQVFLRLLSAEITMPDVPVKLRPYERNENGAMENGKQRQEI